MSVYSNSTSIHNLGFDFSSISDFVKNNQRKIIAIGLVGLIGLNMIPIKVESHNVNLHKITVYNESTSMLRTINDPDTYKSYEIQNLSSKIVARIHNMDSDLSKVGAKDYLILYSPTGERTITNKYIQSPKGTFYFNSDKNLMKKSQSLIAKYSSYAANL